LHEKYLDILRKEMTKPSVKNEQLRIWFDEMWRPGATVGNGSTAAAARVEVLGGAKVKGGDHIQKANNYVVTLQKWIARQDRLPPAQKASRGDYNAAQNVLKDLLNALDGK
jgi:hypothetical protein